MSGACASEQCQPAATATRNDPNDFSSREQAKPSPGPSQCIKHCAVDDRKQGCSYTSAGGFHSVQVYSPASSTAELMPHGALRLAPARCLPCWSPASSCLACRFLGTAPRRCQGLQQQQWAPLCLPSGQAYAVWDTAHQTQTRQPLVSRKCLLPAKP